jgi:hypothetical protein
MNCTTSSLLGIGLLGGSLATMTVSEKEHNTLRQTLSDDLAQKYAEIATERRNHYLIGLVLGIAVSYGVLSFVRTGGNRFYKMSLFFAVTLFTAVAFYSIMPKSDYMLNHLKTPEQNRAWLNIYRTMRKKYFLGFLLGAAAAIPLANAFC